MKTEITGPAGTATPVFFAKAFKVEEGTTLATEIAAASSLAGKRVVIIDHPPTAGLVPLIEGLLAAGAEVHLRDHHADADRDGSTVAACLALLGERAVVTTREANPACATLVQLGEFVGDIIVADGDQDGVTAALKAAGISYPQLEADAAVLDGGQAGKTAEALSSLGFAFVRAWGAIPAFGAPNRDKVFAEVVEALVLAAQGNPAGQENLDRLAVEYERKVAGAKALATTAELITPQFRFVVVPASADFDPPTLAVEMDKDVRVSGRQVTTGPIAKVFGAQVSLARTKTGEEAGLDLATLAAEAFGARPEAGWKPENGVISNTPFLLHLSPERWEILQPLLIAALK